MIAFATPYTRPVRFSPLPFEAFAYVAVGYEGPLFLEQRYLSQAKTLLEVVSTPVPAEARGLLRLLANDAHLKAAHTMELALVGTDTTSAGSGPRITLPSAAPEDPLPKLVTPYTNPVAFVPLPYEVFILVSPEMAEREMYFERRYLDAYGAEIEVRSTQILDYMAGQKVRLSIDRDPLPCAVKVELAIVDTYRYYRGTCPEGDYTPFKIFDFTFDFTFE